MQSGSEEWGESPRLTYRLPHATRRRHRRRSGRPGTSDTNPLAAAAEHARSRRRRRSPRPPPALAPPTARPSPARLDASRLWLLSERAASRPRHRSLSGSCERHRWAEHTSLSLGFGQLHPVRMYIYIRVDRHKTQKYSRSHTSMHTNTLIYKHTYTHTQRQKTHTHLHRNTHTP